MFNVINFENYSETEVMEWLIAQDALYAVGKEVVSDAEYDQIYKLAKCVYPANKYFIGVGASVRGKKCILPYEMGGLEQVYETEIVNIVKKTNSALTVCTVGDKIDGTSAMVIYDADGYLQIAYSKGNHDEGADITRHIRLIPNIPNKIAPTGSTFAIRMEIAIPISDWQSVQEWRKNNSGEPYKNRRNAVAGIMNSKTNDKGIYQYLKGIAYTIITSNISKQAQLAQLSNNFEIVDYVIVTGKLLNDRYLTNRLATQKSKTKYDIDGLVIDLNVPNASFKYKIIDDSNIKVTEVTKIVFEPSKDAYLKPVVYINPVELSNVTVSKSTGFNVKFLKDRQIRPGCKIQITRSGDVIPYILGVDSLSLSKQDYNEWLIGELDMCGEWQWSENEVDAILVDANNPNIVLSLLTDIFTKLSISHLKEGNISALIAAGYIDPIDIINLSSTEFVRILGENGNKVYNSVQEKLNGIYWPVLVGALNLLGRGMGRRKTTMLYDGLKGNIAAMKSEHTIQKVDGFADKTALLVCNKIDYAINQLSRLKSHVSITHYVEPSSPSGTKMVGQTVVFTGVRDKSLENAIIMEGGTIGSGISGKTTILCAKDPNSNSNKVKEARDINVAAGKDIIKVLTQSALSEMLSG